MNKFGVLENEIFGPILSFTYIYRDRINSIAVGFFYTTNPIDHLIVYNDIYIDDDLDIKDVPTKIARLSLLENKILDLYADDSYPEKWILNSNEKNMIFKAIRDNWEDTLSIIEDYQKDNGLKYPEICPY